MKFLLSIFFILFSVCLFAQKPGIVFPKNGQVLQDTSITLIWDAYPNATQYQLTLASDSLFQNLVVNAQSTTDNRQPTTLNSNTTYHGFIRYISPSSSFSSDTFSFTIFSPNSIDSLKYWFSSDYGIITDINNKVEKWKFRNSNFRLYQNNISLRPNLLINGYNGFPSINFQGLNAFLFSDSIIISTGNKSLTTFLLAKTNIYDQQILIGLASNSILSYKIFEVEARNIRMRLWKGNGTNYEYSDKNFNFSNLSIIRASTDSNFKSILQVNHGIPSLNNTVYSFNGVLNKISVGDRSINGVNGSAPFKGELYEVFIINRQLTSTEINYLNTYLLHKYTPPVNIGPNILRRYGFCDTVLRTEKMYESYLWSTGDTTREITVAKEDTGWYWCQVPNLYGQMMRDSVYVYNFLPKQDIQDTTICIGDTITYISSFAQGYQIPTHNQQPTTHNSQPTTYYNGYSFLWKDISTNDTLSNTPTLQFSSSPARQLALSVFDTLGCFITDTFNIFVDSFPVLTSLGADKSLCTGDKIGLAVGNNEADSFLWNTSLTDSLIIINTAGTYTLQTWNFRGCSAKDTVEVDIHGVTPYVAFSALPVCFGDSTTFIDSSMSLDQSNLISWNWEYGDGKTFDTLVPSYPRTLYDSAALYTAKLTVSTDSGCTNYAYHQVLVRPLPEPNFMPLTACQNHDVQLQNLSVHSDSITTYRWIFNQIDTLFANSPVRQFANSGSQSIQLTPYDIHGCNASITQTFNVRPTPSANFNYTTVCQGTPINFSDSSITEIYNPIQSYEWNFFDPLFPGSIYTPASSFLFDSAGFYPVWLKVTSLNGCWDTITKIVALNPFVRTGMNPLPICEDQFQNLFGAAIYSSIVPAFIDEFSWTLDDKIISNQQNAVVLLSDTLQHKVKFYLRTTASCEDSIIKYVHAFPRPTASFTIDIEYGLPPLEIQFTNTTTSKYSQLISSWFFGDGSAPLLNASSQIVNHTYVDSAVFYPMLIVSDSLGCLDSATKTVNAIYAAIDISMTNIIANLDGDYIQYSCDISNLGKQPVKELNFIARYNDGMEISENWQGNLASGQSMTYTFNSRTKIRNPLEFRYYCIEAALPATATQQDEQLANNIRCKDWITDFWVSNPYPNPVGTELRLDLILPIKQQVDFQITTIQGQHLQTYIHQGQKGLNQVQIKLDQYPSGQYTIIIQTKENREVRSFLVE